MIQARSEHAEAVTKMLKEVIAAFTDNPQSLTITVGEDGALTLLDMRCHPDDYGKIVGSLGAHIKALQYLVADMGELQDMDFKLTLLDHGGRPRRFKSPPAVCPADWNPMPAAELLARTIKAVTGYDVTVTPAGGGASWFFDIRFADAFAVQAVQTPYDEDPEKMTVFAALETLWNAYAKKEGTAFRLRVV